jgi:hypothetical protein
MKQIKSCRYLIRIPHIHKTYFNMQIWQTFAKIKKHQIIFIKNCLDTIAGTRDTKITIQQANNECWQKNTK